MDWSNWTICCSPTIESRHCHKMPFRAFRSSNFCGLIQAKYICREYSIIRIIHSDLEGNEISYIHKEAFSGFTALEDLNLGNNIFPQLPESGLRALLHLKTFNNPKLREFPPPDTFPRIQTLILSYAYHCCAFLPLVAMSSQKKTSQVQEAVLFPSDAEFDMTLWNNSMMNIWPQMRKWTFNV